MYMYLYVHNIGMIIIHVSISHRVTILEKLVVHLHVEHHEKIEIKETIFNNSEEFQKWKESIERETNSSFILRSAPATTLDNTTSYYYCNRTGIYKPEGKGKRQLKSQGSNKIGYQCSAYIRATQLMGRKEVSVRYCLDHYNHDLQLAFLRIPEQTRMEIARKLQLGVTIERVLDDIRETCETGINREHLVTRQDIRNIQSQYNIQGIMRHANDLSSVRARVTEMQSMQYNPIILFKEQGTPQPAELDDFSDEGFILCFQTAFQRDMLVKFGKHIICMDATHGTNAYDFQLISIVVVDEYGEGLPVGWMISNREDTTALCAFLNAIKTTCGIIEPEWFMSDDAEQYFNAWKGVFGGNRTRKVLCVWHIDRSWRKALHDHIKDKEEQIYVYHSLCLLLQELDEPRFRVMLQSFLTHLYTNHKRFYIYFQNVYCSRLQEWAACYRKGCTANTNMFVESFHRVLKVVYLHHKQNRRIDFLLITLTKIARNKTFERLRKVEMGKNTHRICEISKRHKSAIAISPDHLTPIQHNKWNVRSNTESTRNYTVEKIQDSCDCKVVCQECQICPHIYNCDCLDATIHATVCKHAHFVHMETRTQSTRTSTKDRSQKTVEYSYFSNVLPLNHLERLNGAKKRFFNELKELEKSVSFCTSTDAIQTALKHIQAASTIIKALTLSEKATLTVKRKISPNQNHEKQQKFFSTKKRRMITSTLSKPTLLQSEKCRTELKRTDPIFCGNCLKENDINLANQVIQWIQCDKCSMWLHLSCITPTLTSVPDVYTCNLCLP